MTINLGEINSGSTSDRVISSDERTKVFSVTVTDYVSLVKVRIEYSYDNLSWENVTDYDYEITGNDTYNLIVTNILPTANLRFNYISGDATLNVRYINY